MMAVEGPFLAAVIARLGDPKFNLAAHGVAFAFALVVAADNICVSCKLLIMNLRVYYIKLIN